MRTSLQRLGGTRIAHGNVQLTADVVPIELILEGAGLLADIALGVQLAGQVGGDTSIDIEVRFAQVSVAHLNVGGIRSSQVSNGPIQRSTDGIRGADAMGVFDQFLRQNRSLVGLMNARQLLAGLEDGVGQHLLCLFE